MDDESNLKTPIRERYAVDSVDDREFQKYSHTKESNLNNPNYYKEFLSVRESLLSYSMTSKRRGSINEEDLSDLPHHNPQKKSRSRSCSRNKQ